MDKKGWKVNAITSDDQSNSAQDTPETPRPQHDPGHLGQHAPKSRKTLLWAIVALSVALAMALALILALLTDRDKDTSKSSSSNSSQSDNKEDVSTPSPTKTENLATVDTQKPGVSLTVTSLKKAGNTLVVNYKLNYAATDNAKEVYASAFDAGVYTTTYQSVPEPYFISDADGQKYGVVKDSNGNALASASVSGYVKKGQSLSGYVTLTLPPNNAAGSLSMGSMPLIPGLTVKY